MLLNFRISRFGFSWRQSDALSLSHRCSPQDGMNWMEYSVLKHAAWEKSNPALPRCGCMSKPGLALRAPPLIEVSPIQCSPPIKLGHWMASITSRISGVQAWTPDGVSLTPKRAGTYIDEDPSGVPVSKGRGVLVSCHWSVVSRLK